LGASETTPCIEGVLCLGDGVETGGIEDRELEFEDDGVGGEDGFDETEDGVD